MFSVRGPGWGCHGGWLKFPVYIFNHRLLLHQGQGIVVVLKQENIIIVIMYDEHGWVFKGCPQSALATALGPGTLVQWTQRERASRVRPPLYPSPMTHAALYS